MTVSTVPTASFDSTSVLALIADDMVEVDRVIAQRLSSDVAMVGQIAQYIISSGGKRLRPALLLLLARALGHQSEQRFHLAAVVEFIHTATLLHDDVVDASALRRGRATANQAFGNAASVLVGDFLYSRAFQMMVQVNDMRVMQILAHATNVIAEGEVQQLMNMHDADLTEQGYLEVIRSKTAKLFEASARLAAILAQADEAVEQACATYGQALGTAFQIVDDILDYTGDSQELGKNVGDDLREGKATLPLILGMQRADAPQAAVIRQAIEQGNPDSLERIVQIVRDSGALQQAQDVAQAEARRAVEALKAFPDNFYVQGLLQLANSLLYRRV